MKPTTYPIGTRYNAKGHMWSLGRHTGCDYLTPVGSRLVAPADGTVKSVGYNSAYGNNVIIRTKNRAGADREVSVNHLRHGGIVVKTGQKVRAGQLVGYSGATGNVSGPHCHEEDRRYPFTFGSDVDPAEFNDWDNAPKVVIPRPKIAPKLWFGIVTVQLAGMNDHGRATLPTRAPKIADKIKSLTRAVVCVQELPDGFVDDFDKLMSARGFKRVPGGSDGRYIYVLKSVRVGRSGVFDLRPRYKADDKQAAWAELYPNGPNAVLVTNMHLESDDPADSERVGQALSAHAQGSSKAKALGIPTNRTFYVGDTNSDNLVREAFNDVHFEDAEAVAWSTWQAKVSTWLGWGAKPHNGARIDLILVHRSRPVRRHAVVVKSAGLSDHLFVVADIGKL